MSKPLYLECTTGNSSKFYLMTPSPDNREFTATYGRIGSLGTSTSYPMSMWDKKLNEKLRKGYVIKQSPFTDSSNNVTYSPERAIEQANQKASKYIILTGTDGLNPPLKITDKNGAYHVYYRIMSKCDIALPSGQVISQGTLGGFVEAPECLDQTGDCWVADNARVSCDARIRENAFVGENAVIDGKACIYGNAMVTGEAIVSGEAIVFGNAHIYENAIIKDSARVLDRALVGGKTTFGGAAMVCEDAWYETDFAYLESKIYGNTVLNN